MATASGNLVPPLWMCASCVVACIWLLLGGEAWGHMSVATDQAWESGSRGGGRTWVGEQNAVGASREERLLAV